MTSGWMEIPCAEYLGRQFDMSMSGSMFSGLPAKNWSFIPPEPLILQKSGLPMTGLPDASEYRRSLLIGLLNSRSGLHLTIRS